jgi:hypothetical protein
METGMHPNPFTVAGAAEDKGLAWRFILNAETRKQFWLDDDTAGFCRKTAFVLGAVYIVWVAYWFVGFFLIFPMPAAMEIFRIAAMVIPKILIKDGAILLLIFIGALTLHDRYRKTNILVDAQGMHFQGFVFKSIRGFYAWDEFAQIRSAVFRKQDVLVFIDRYGASFRIPFGKDVKRGFWARYMHPACFLVGDGHELVLPEAIERFYSSPVTPLSEAEHKRVPALYWGRGRNFNWNPADYRSAFVFLLALAFVLVGVFGNSGFFLLDTWKSPLVLIYGLAIGTGFLFAWRCLKPLRQESWETVWVVSLVFAAALWFLVATVAPLLPVWLGKARQETFFLQEEGVHYSSRQTWHAVRDKDMPFSRSFGYTFTKERPRSAPGTEKEFTLYCFLGLCAISTDEIDALRLSSPDAQSGTGDGMPPVDGCKQPGLQAPAASAPPQEQGCDAASSARQGTSD